VERTTDDGSDMQATGDGVGAFVDRVTSPVRRRDAHTLLDLMARVTGETPRMWGPSIIGFGEYHYRYATGREGDACAAGFSPRAAATTIYLPDGVEPYERELDGLGDHTTGVGCLYLRDLDRVDLGVLERIVATSYRRVTAAGFGQHTSDSRDG
jgi:hypothetical protein